MSDRDVVIRVENISKLYRLGEVGTGSLAHDVNRWWHKVRGKEDPYLKIGEVNDRTKSVSSVQRPASSAKNANALDPRRSSLDSSAPALDSTPSSSSRPLDPGLSTPSSSEALDSSAPALDSTPSSSSRPLDPGLSTPSSSALDSRPSTLVSAPPASDWGYALKDVSFEVKRGELRTLGRSEKEISKKCLGATKVPDSGRRRHQLLDIIGRNGAGNQAAG
jgi:hypothetical protein